MATAQQQTFDFKLRFDAFAVFYDKHPEVYQAFVERSLQIRKHRDTYSARTIIEVIRWHTDLGDHSKKDWQINNNFIPYLARLAMLRNNELEHFFQQRTSRYDVTDQQLLTDCNQIDAERKPQEESADMRAFDLCPSKQISSKELDGEITVTIRDVGFETVGRGEERCGIVYFDEFEERGMIVNVTRRDHLIQLLGPETDDWIGQRLVIYPGRDDHTDEPTISIRGVQRMVMASDVD